MYKSNVNAQNMSLKVMINKEKTKVVFAEANGDFVNVLLSFLTLPLGKIVTIIQKHNGFIGSLTTLYQGLSELDTALFSAPGAKEMLLNPQSSFQTECRTLSLDIGDTEPMHYFLCEDENCIYSDISKYSDVAKCYCGRSVNRKRSIVDHLKIGTGEEYGAFVYSSMYFIISDDLRVAPISLGSFEALAGFGITDTQGGEMKSLRLGFQDIIELLKLSLTSATPLTDMIVKKTTVENSQCGILLDPIIHQDDAATESTKLVLRAFFHKSTNKFVFAEATDELVELLLSFLAVPLGGVVFLLGSSTPFKNIYNLYRSVANGIDDKYFTNPNTKKKLISPNLPHGYVFKNQLLPLSKESMPESMYVNWTWKWMREFVKKQMMCYVSDDLTMSPSLASKILILNDAGILLSDLKETEFHIGSNEVLSILKASLISKTALTDGLFKLMPMSHPKKESC